MDVHYLKPITIAHKPWQKNVTQRTTFVSTTV